ncbi:Flagellar protein [Phytophthora megakarya]|uniref:Flagellar protein n=1 Tax=Phytophthora megakarya TaxID=4795 RepID=A0A225X349_9STRA|nr:Flagellar protein [Phytophthora megakarya]
MATPLLRWLNQELELSTQVTDMEVDFANGYLLGEILHRLNHQHNFKDFMRSSSADAKILNFCLLEPTLRNLNIKFDATVASSIMNEQENAAANLLYQIKIAADRVARAPGVSTKSLERTGIIPLHNRPVKLAKPAYDSEEHRQFEHSVRRHVQSITSLQQKKDQIAEEATKREAYLASLKEQKEVLEATKAERLHRAYIHSSFIKEALEETDSPAWRLALQKKSAREQRRAAFLQQMLQKREEAENNFTFSLRRKVQCDLDDFDAQVGSKGTIEGGKVSSRKSAGYGLRSLTTALNTAADKKKHSTSNLAGSPVNEMELYHANVLEMDRASGVIKRQKQRREKRKENLSRRRKRFVQESVYTHSRIGSARVTSILEDVVLRDTNSEKDIHGAVDRILVYKEVARENRAMRNQEYANQQEVDSLSAIDRDTSCYHNLLLQFEDDREMQVVQQSDVQLSIDAADRFLSEQISGAITKELVEFVMFIAGRREETLHSRDPNTFLFAETWNEYKTKFANAYNLKDTSPLVTSEDTSQIELLNCHELQQYLLNFQSLFSATDQQPQLKTIDDGSLFVGAEEVIKDCFILGEEIKSLRWIARFSSHAEAGGINTGSIVPTAKLPTTSSHGQLRVFIFGPPFAGREEQAKLLGEAHNLDILSVHELMQNAIENSSEIGRQVKDLLIIGKEIPQELYSQVVMEYIVAVEAQATGQNNTNKAGWVIYDLPATEQHAKSLEEHLTGYVDPQLIPSPYDFESAIAPGRIKPEVSPTFLYGKSGVDLVFHIDCPIGTTLDRCLGRVEDGTTGNKYHLVFEPPPDESIERHRLHHVNPSAYSSELLSLHGLANDGFSHDHKAWHAKFKTLHELSTGMTPTEIHEVIAEVVNRLLQERKDEVDTKQHQQEADEHVLMEKEEERQRRLNSFESEIGEAQIEVTKVEASITAAEETKAKKEEMMELKQKLDEAQRQLDNVMGKVNSWVDEEKLCRPVPTSKYSGELMPATAQALSALWNSMEAEYISTMKTSFELLRNQRHRVTDRAQLMTSEFCEFVRRLDQKQEVVNAFQKQFNEVIEEMRFDDQTKLELHARADTLHDELESLIVTKVAENDEELSGMFGDGWTEDTCQQVAVIYQMALQAEIDRFRTSIQILVDGHYAASSDRPQLSSIVEIWHTHQPRLELSCRIYRDPANDTPVEIPTAPVTTGKAAPKGKGKASVAAVVPPTNVTAANSEEALAEALTMTELLAEYAHVLQRCGMLMEAITPIANTVAESVANDHGNTHQQDTCKVNLLNGIKYEHNLMEQRVRYLQEATEKARDEITRTMRSIEITLRDVLQDRRDREQVAVAALVEYVRTAIEAEPKLVDRFPPTLQLREDTTVHVDEGKRLLPRMSPDAPPVVEETHELLLNLRQRECIREILTSQTIDNSGLLPLITAVETITALTSLPDALPAVWRRCPAHVIAAVSPIVLQSPYQFNLLLVQIATQFTQQSFVDVDALVTAMSTRDDLLHQFQQDEAQNQQERQEPLQHDTIAPNTAE